MQYDQKRTQSILLDYLIKTYTDLFCWALWRWSVLLYPHKSFFDGLNCELLEKLKLHSYSIGNLVVTRTFVNRILISYIDMMIARKSIPYNFSMLLKEGKDKAIQSQLEWYKAQPECGSKLVVRADRYTELLIEKLTSNDVVTHFVIEKPFLDV